MRSLLARSARAAVLAFGILSCTDSSSTEPRALSAPERGSFTAGVVTSGAKVRISQVYGAGGNGGATYNADFVELYNYGTVAEDLEGWSVQGTSAASTGLFGASGNVALHGTIQPGQYYLVGGTVTPANGVALPATDASGNLNVAASAGKVVLVTQTANLACNGSSTPCSSAQLAQIVDLVGFGTTANFFEGTGPAPAPDATHSIARFKTPEADNNQNNTDFQVIAPTPRNRAFINVSIAPANPTVNSGDLVTLTASASANGAAATLANVVWSTNNSAIGPITTTADPNVVTIQTTGTGTATISLTATVNGSAVGASTKLTVNAALPPTIDHITITGTTPITTGTTAQFSATAFDAANVALPTQPSFTWTPVDATIATVTSTGVVKGIAPGTTTIKAAAGGKEGTFSVTVADAPNFAGTVVISQVYGGGGNGGSTFKNDYIELFNRGPSTVTLTGWSVQYSSSSSANFTNVTALNGTIAPGHYYLVKESAGAGGTTDLPTPDATGGITMGANAGFVVLAQTTVALGTGCPTGTLVVDAVSYGTSGCGATAPTLANSTAAFRKNGGCLWTSATATTDFGAAADANPRNSTNTHSCTLGPLHDIALTGGSSLLAGSTLQLFAEARDADGNTLTIPITWATGDATIATVSATGLVTGVAVSDDPVVISASAVQNGVTITANQLVTVNSAGGIHWLDVSYDVTDNNTHLSNLPPGFQAKIFLKARDANAGTIIPATFTVESLDPDLATVLTDGALSDGPIIAAVAAPSDPTRRPRLKITATPTDGGAAYIFTTTGSTALTIPPPVSLPASSYGNNDEFGDPTPASASTPNDFLIRRNQYVISYNQSRGTPNWVSYELDPRQIGASDRCNCFTSDQTLPAANRIYYTDYTGGGYDRGHMMPSADRTGGNEDNAASFYMTNMVPQVGDLNQGVWANLEQAIRDSVNAGRAAYIIVGPLYSRSHGLTFLNGGTKVAIPDSTWKIAIIGPRNGGNPFTRGSLDSWDALAGLSVVAVNMPNIQGVRNDDWHKYLTTIDKIEAATGYDFLSLLNTAFQNALEAGDHAPVAKFSFSGTQNEASALSFDASASSDPDIGRADAGFTEALSYQWHFSDGSQDVTGKTTTHTFADNGTYTVTLMVTDAFGWQRTTTQSIVIANVNPTASFSSPATGVEGTVFQLALSGVNDVSSVDMASLTYAFDCGSGTYAASQTYATFNCTPPDNGTYTVRARVTDKDGGFTEYSGTIEVSNANPSAVFSAPNVNEGSAIVLTLASATDPSPADAAALKFAFDCGSGFGSPSSSNTASCPTTDNGTRTVRGRVIDKDGGSADYMATVTIANVAPTGTLVAPASVTEGTVIPVSITDASDAASDDIAAGFTYAYDCGAGFAAPVAASSAGCPTSDNGTRTVRVRIIDKDGGVSEYTATVNVTNVAPSVTLGATTPVSIVSGGSVSVGGSFTDPGSDSPWHSTIDWGNGTTTAGTQTASGASVTGSKTYLTAGTYTVLLSVTDKDGGVGASQPVTITVGRRAVTGDVNPSSINLNDNGNGDITFRLYGDASVDITTLDVASVKIGTVGVNQDNQGRFDSNFEQGGRRASLKFSRKALIDAGALTAQSTQLVLIANLKDGRQIVSQVSVDIH